MDGPVGRLFNGLVGRLISVRVIHAFPQGPVIVIGFLRQHSGIVTIRYELSLGNHASKVPVNNIVDQPVKRSQAFSEFFVEVRVRRFLTLFNTGMSVTVLA